MAKYSKPFLTFDEQIDLLIARGMNITDRVSALSSLRRHGYYRLSAYWYPFRIRPSTHREGIDTPSDHFVEGIDLEDIVKIADFDGLLRLGIWPAIEAVEVAIRVAIAYQMGQHGAYAYVDPMFLAPGASKESIDNPGRSQLQDFRERMQRSVRSSKESFALHFREKYEGALPVWAAIELWDFGTLSVYYQIMQPEDRAAVAKALGLHSARLLGSWLGSLNVLRNISAHHGRLNRRHFAIGPKIPKPQTSEEFAHLYPLADSNLHSLYTILCVLSYLMLQIRSDRTWQDGINQSVNHIESMRLVKYQDYGFPDDWERQLLWRAND